MNLKIGRVVSNTDYTRTGKLQVKIADLGNSVVEVTYTTPFFLQGFGGLIAVPEPTSMVLVAQVKSELDDGRWFYMGTIVDELVGDATKENRMLGVQGFNDLNTIKDQNETYQANNTPERISLTSPKGNSLILSDSSNEKYNNIKAELKSPSGKSIQVNDSTNIDSVIVRNEHGDRIKITSEATGLSGARSIELESKGSVKMISREGGVDIIVEDGTDLNIFNNSTGTKADPNFPGTAGNINIKSSRHNVNIDSPEANINIVAGSDISITSGAVVNIQCSEFNVDSATNNFNMK